MGVLDSFRLDDKVVVVTGASSGLGVSFAQAFAEAGADVVWARDASTGWPTPPRSSKPLAEKR